MFVMKRLAASRTNRVIQNHLKRSGFGGGTGALAAPDGLGAVGRAGPGAAAISDWNPSSAARLISTCPRGEPYAARDSGVKRQRPETKERFNGVVASAGVGRACPPRGSVPGEVSGRRCVPKAASCCRAGTAPATRADAPGPRPRAASRQGRTGGRARVHIGQRGRRG